MNSVLRLLHHHLPWLAVFSLLCLVIGCDVTRQSVPQKTFLVMGTIASVSLPADQADKLETVAELVTDTISALEREFSVYMSESEISQINKMAGQQPVSISDETVNMLEISRYYSELTDGAFDITVGPVMRAWGLNNGIIPKRPLTKEQIAVCMEKVGYNHIVLSENTAFLNEIGSQIDLGGIAKGYAVDISCHKLLGRGIQNVMINLGGNIRCLGYATDSKPWIIGVRNPFQPKRILGTLQLSNGQSVATSGNYERFITINNKHYAHIVDPRTGWPVEGVASVTVISHSAVEADALSTALFVQGMKKGMSTLKKTALSEALFIPDKQPIEIWVTKGFADRFVPLAAVSNRVFLLE